MDDVVLVGLERLGLTAGAALEEAEIAALYAAVARATPAPSEADYELVVDWAWATARRWRALCLLLSGDAAVRVRGEVLELVQMEGDACLTDAKPGS